MWLRQRSCDLVTNALAQLPEVCYDTTERGGEMSYGWGNHLDAVWKTAAEWEESDLPRNEFVARNCKAFQKTMVIAAALSTVIGTVLILRLDVEVGSLFLVFGVALLLLLPTVLSYRCYVDKTCLREEYYLLFFKRRKEILWDDVAYRKMAVGRGRAITLYDKNKKRLISFDETVVGYNRIVKLAKRSAIKEFHK